MVNVARDKTRILKCSEGTPRFNRAEWVAMGEKLRKRMIGRIYTQEVVERAERISIANREP